MKKTLFLFRLFALVATLTCALGAHADYFYYDNYYTKENSTFCVNGIYYFINDDGYATTVSVTSGDEYNYKYSGRVEIPSSVTYNGKNYQVTRIGMDAFRGCSGLTSVSIPNSVTVIADNAFDGCSSLTNVVVPNSVDDIDMSAFANCTSLTSVTLGSSLLVIEDYVFYNCPNLTSVTCLATTPPTFYNPFLQPIECPFDEAIYGRATLYVPKGCYSAYHSADWWKNFTSIEELAVVFEYNGIYYNITGENTVEVTYKDTNYNCYSGNVTIPSSVYYGGKDYSVTAIGEAAFRGSSGLTGVTIPTSVTSIGNQAFYICTGLTSVTVPNSVTTLGMWAFNGCSNLLSVTLSNALQTINDYTFFACNRLTSIVIPNSVTTIGYRVFYNCNRLSSISIPASVTTIGDETFTNCVALKSVTCHGTTPPTISSGTFMSSHYSSTTLHVPRGYKSVYQAANYWTNFTVIQEPVYSFVVDGIYYYITGTNTVEVTFRGISYSAYSGFVSIPGSVTYNGVTYTVNRIATLAFMNCSELTSVEIPASVASIGEQAFYDCTALSSVICLGATPPTMGASNVFSTTTYNSALLYVPKDCKSTYQSANWWKNFTHIEEPSYSFVVDGIYYNITSTNTVEVTYKDINYNSYSGYLTIPGSVSYGGKTYTVTAIGSRAFYGSMQLYDVKIPNTVTTIGQEAFYGCVSLGEVILPVSLTSIGSRAFASQTLNAVMCYAPNPPALGSSVFDSSTYSYATLTVREGSLSAYQSAVGWQNFSRIETGSYDFVVNGIYYSITSVNTVAVTFKDTEYQSYSGTVTIPSSVTYEGSSYTVTAIGPRAFRDCMDLLTAVNIPSTVTTIGEAAFAGCYLTSIVLPNSITSIGDYAFWENPLESINFPEGLIRIGNWAFNMSHLQSVTLPNSLTTIGNNAFFECYNLKSLVIGKSVTSIGEGAFNCCPDLMSVTCLATTPPMMAADYVFDDATYSAATLTVPRGCKSAYQVADWWKNFTTIKEKGYDFVANGIYYMINGDNAVEVTYKTGYNTYSGNVTIPSSVTYGGTTYSVTAIGEAAFRESAGLTSVAIPATVTAIGNYGFYNCTGLTSVVIPKSVTTIGTYAFNNCTNLANVTLGSSVATINYQAFRNCPALVSVTCLATTPPTIASTTFATTHFSNVLLFVPKGCESSYQAKNYWKNFTRMQNTLDYALNGGGGTIEFHSAGNYPWTNVVEDGRVYARSGNAGIHSSLSTLTTTVTLPRDGKVTFAYKAWGEGSSSDKCIFKVDSEEKFSYGNKQNNWINYTVQLSAGRHTLMWVYSKNGSGNPEGDYFAVDNVVVTVNTVPGDIDGDGEVGIADVADLVDLILSGTATVQDYPAADVDGDGLITVADAADLLDIVLGN